MAQTPVKQGFVVLNQIANGIFLHLQLKVEVSLY